MALFGIQIVRSWLNDDAPLFAALSVVTMANGGFGENSVCACVCAKRAQCEEEQ